MTDYLAARMNDPLRHSSAIADFVSGLVEGAVVVGAMALAATGIGSILVAVAVGALMVSGKLTEIGNAAGDFVGGLFPRGSPDAFIASGSHNVQIMKQKAARAAGTVNRAWLESGAAEEGTDWLGLGLGLLVGVANTARIVMNPMGALVDTVRKEGVDGLLEDAKSFSYNVWESLAQPVVESASPYATAMPEDRVNCTKGHAITTSNFIAQGSKKVLINNQPAARNGDKSTCEAVIELVANPRVRIGGDTVTVRDIHNGKNMLAYYAGVITGSLGIGLLRQLLKEGISCLILRQMGRDFACPLMGAMLDNIGGTVMSAAVATAVVGSAQTAHPVNIATGAKVLAGDEELDFVLQDRIPLHWQRIYHSRNTATGMLGQGWMLPFETRLHRLANNQLIYKDMSGREMDMGEVNPGDVIFFQQDGLKLFCSPNGAMILQTDQGEFQLYEPDPTRPNQWRIQSIYDRHENVHYFDWDNQGRLTRISSDNEELNVELDYTDFPDGVPEGRLGAVYQVYDGTRHLLVSYQYNARGQLTHVADADSIVTRRFGWDDASGMLAWHAYATGLTLHYQWQASTLPGAPFWRVCAWQVCDDQGNQLESWHFDTDEAARHTRLYNDNGVTSYHHWDTLSRITRYTDTHGGDWRFTWSGATEQLLTLTEPEGGVWEFAWDERGNQTLVRDPLDRATLTTWHPWYSFPVKEVLPDGAVWQYEYNVAGDVISVTDPQEGVTRFEWNEQGDLIRRTDALENSHRFWWNWRGQRVREEDCSGHQSHWVYDAAGRLVQTTDAQGNAEQYSWSPASRLAVWRRADGRETRFDYNHAGLLCGQSVDGMLESHVVLNARGQVTEAVNPAGQVTRFDFSPEGRLLALTNGNRQQWRFDYSPQGLLRSESDYAGRRTEYRYNAAQQVVTQTRYPEAGSTLAPQVLNFEYDGVGRLVARETAQHRTEYRYSALATEIRRMPYAAWRQSVVTGREPQETELLVFRRNLLGDLVSEENADGTYLHDRDALGNLRATTYPDGRQLQYLRYGTGHLLEMQLSLGGQTHSLAGYQRDRLHRETSRTAGPLQLETEYDVVGRVTRQHCADSTRSQLVYERRYQWDRADQIIREMLTDGAPTGPGEKYRQSLWGYDAAGRLTQSHQPGREEHFWYDGADNRTDATLHPVWNNLLKRLEGVAREYDGFGRMVTRHDTRRGVKQTFTYDEEQRISAVELEGDPVWRRAEYRYDALGRRTEKRLWKRHQDKDTFTQIRYAWSGLQLVGEHDNTRSGAAVQYVYEEGSYQPLARVESQGNAVAGLYWYHGGLNGLPEQVTDEEGRRVWRGVFSAWGRTEQESGGAHWHVAQNLRFQGQYLDRETGLHYNTFRYYDPAGACYTQKDPIGLAGGINLYSYVPNPLAWVDPLGLTSCNLKTGDLGKNGTEIASSVTKKGQSKAEILFNNMDDAKNWASNKLGLGKTRMYDDTGKWIGWTNKSGDKVYWGHGDWGKGVGKSTFPHLNYEINGTSGHLFLRDKIINRGQWDEFTTILN